ncbi:MAG: hypothetical protein HQK82_07275 [Desulfovibrionaceae bacterium]|nr:hypothetical protein [Desulfovibrionaceae bacterium]
MEPRDPDRAPLALAERLLFDDNDHALLAIVSEVLARGDVPGLRRLLAPHLHPHGIKELAASQGLRVAYAMAHLLGSLTRGEAEDRLAALRVVREEALYASQSRWRINTARVLAQIMKELVRGQGTRAGRLRLAHEFRLALAGNPRYIKSQLRKYHLIELSEEWNQLSFDEHVHDANTKGRKSPTHLILDAWIKGIRRLTVIYYNYVEAAAARELLEAAAIMGVAARIGIEFRVRFRGRQLKLIWVPRGFDDNQGYLDFLGTQEVKRFLHEAQKVSKYHEWFVFAALERFNRVQRPLLCERFGIDLTPVAERDLTDFAGAGQLSFFHLGRLIYERLLPLFENRARELTRESAGADPARRADASALVAAMESLDPDALIDEYLEHVEGGVDQAPGDMSPPAEPELLRLAPAELIEKLGRLHTGHRFILNLGGLSAADVLEILYDCGGDVTHLEIVNLRNQTFGKCRDTGLIAELQTALSLSKAIRLKQVVQTIIDTTGEEGGQKAKLAAILSDFGRLCGLYSLTKPLKSTIGSDSTGESRRARGMGLVVAETLPAGSRRILTAFTRAAGLDMPVRVAVHEQISLPSSESQGRPGKSPAAGPAWLRRLCAKRTRTWVKEKYLPAGPGESNILVLGGVHTPPGFAPDAGEKSRADDWKITWTDLNSHLKNSLKILIGLVPAALTFALTKSWWLLAWFGPLIWFCITGLRNVIQSVLGRGGLRRSPLLPWQSYVSWGQVADSLMYTGFSVPLLDYLVKTALLNRGLGLTAVSAPIAVYSAMALANGLYLCGHNLLRAFPAKVAAANIFRSVLSAPLAMALSYAAAKLLTLAGAPDPAASLQQWAAIISKLSSDCVAAVIEGQSDRATYVRLRSLDYASKLRRLFAAYSSLEILFPSEKALSLLDNAGALPGSPNPAALDLKRVITVHALDFLYFWYYQPRARTVLEQSIREMPREERRVFLLSQCVLLRKREISELFLGGLVGKNFSKALAFYLDHAKDYLRALQDLCGREFPKERQAIAAVIDQYQREDDTPPM